MVKSSTGASRAVADAAPAAAAKSRKRLSLDELRPAAREAIFVAATRVVGDIGYANATVARIAQAADIAQGTFYLYFDSRQQLFDELLTHARQEMLRLVRSRMAGAADFFEREERGMRAFLAYLQTTPGFFRILNEAETAAPETFRRHYQDIAGRYVRLLRRAGEAGEIRVLEDAEFQTATYLIMNARISLQQLCVLQRPKPRVSVDHAVGYYMDMLRAWLAPAAID